MCTRSRVQGLTEKVSRVFKKGRVSVAVRPHFTIKNILVHPEDKPIEPRGWGVYSIDS